MSRKTPINIIACVNSDYALGKDNELLYYISDDMKNFRNMTIGNTVIMGRKTLESLPEKKSLKNRNNIVITSQDLPSEGNLYYVKSPEEAITLAEKLDKGIFIIGGASVYSYFIDSLRPGDKVILTLVADKNKPADVYFPKFDKSEFILSETDYSKDEKSGYHYKIQSFTKKKLIFVSLPFTGYETTIQKRLNDCLNYISENLPEYCPVYQSNINDIASSGISFIGDEYNKIMLDDLRLIEESDAVLFGKYWEESSGCNAEWTIARLFKKKLFYQN